MKSIFSDRVNCMLWQNETRHISPYISMAILMNKCLSNQTRIFTIERAAVAIVRSCSPMASQLLRQKWPLMRPSSRTLVLPARSSSVRSMANGQPQVRKEDVVIVGAGIAGLAAAVSLQREGIGSIVLEQAESLRIGGTSLTLSNNGWKSLDAIGVGNELKTKFLRMQGIDMKTEDGSHLRSVTLNDTDPSQEVRPVERRILLEALVNQLPPNTISFSSKLKHIEKSGNDESLLKLEDDSQISAKIVIACDGVWSPVAKWMGFRDPKYAGYSAVRGLGLYPAGHAFGQRVSYYFGRGLRAGFVPISSTKVYWFVTFNTPPTGSKISDPSTLRQETKELLKGFPSKLLKVAEATPDDMLVRSPIVDRWLWPVISPPASKGKVVLLGDAWHPMTPNLGQGACCALEDAVLLTQKLAQAINHGSLSVEEAFRSYESERWPQIFSTTISAHLVGAIGQTENPLVRYVRDKIFAFQLNALLSRFKQTNLDLGPKK